MSLKDFLVGAGVMMFLIGACALDSSLEIGATLSLSGVAIGLIGEKFFY